jgi:hypothetical protein
MTFYNCEKNVLIKRKKESIIAKIEMSENHRSVYWLCTKFISLNFSFDFEKGKLNCLDL